MKANLIILISVLFLVSNSAKSQERITQLINSNWAFHKGDLPNTSSTDNWEKISLPHTWNAKDVMDDEPGYYRGVGWYKKTIYLPASWKDKEVYIYFEGAAQVTEVFLNGKSVGKHIGSYSAFTFRLNAQMKLLTDGNSANELTIKVDNSADENIPPLSADFTFYGGVYRDVYLVASNKIHFDRDNYASNGVFITTPAVSATTATVKIKGAVSNTSKSPKNILIVHQISDDKGEIVGRIQHQQLLKAGEKLNFDQDFRPLAEPKLWSIENPYLYQVSSQVLDADSKTLIDEVTNPLGLRWFKFDAEKGFFLNGKSVKLIGASRHQDFKDLGNALSDAIQVRDVELLKEMGGNFLRIAHYPQDPSIIEACDRLGILTSLETPIVNRITETKEFYANSKLMHLEMIRQNFNHPSLIIWAYMNEVLLQPRYAQDSVKRMLYFNNIAQLAKELEDLTLQEDTARYTMIPNHGAFDLYHKVGLTTIPKLVGWNLYTGWYSGKFSDFGIFLDKHRKLLPQKPLLVTEYGADADQRLHSFNPVRFDKTVEYTTAYHISYLKAIKERPFVAAAVIWNLAEFNAEQRADAMPHINNKGLLTGNRLPKDGYRFYQANLLKTPYVQIGSREWTRRTGVVNSETSVCLQPVQVFSNQSLVKLKVNGVTIGDSKSVNGIATFTVPFVNGLNQMVASTVVNGVEILDQTMVAFKLIPQNLSNTLTPFKEINVSLGDQRYYFDETTQQNWLPEQAYQLGSWGYVGGKVFMMAKRGRQSYGSDKNILGTENDPIYATQRVGIEQFKFDVPPGVYELTLHFAELLSNEVKEELVYNLSLSKETDHFKERVFDVTVNGKEVLSRLSNKENILPEVAYSTKCTITVKKSEGVSVDFKPIIGEAILNGIQLFKIR